MDEQDQTQQNKQPPLPEGVRVVPSFDNKVLKKEKSEKKRGKGCLIFLLIILTLLILLFTNIIGMIVSILPEGMVNPLFSGFYKKQILVSKPYTYDKPVTFTGTYAVYGFDSLLCFKFETLPTDPDIKISSTGALLNKKNNAAMVSAKDKNGKIYKLDTMDIIQGTDKDKQNIFLCYGLTKNLSILPNDIKNISVVPSFPFTALSTEWVTKKDIRMVRMYIPSQ